MANRGNNNRVPAISLFERLRQTTIRVSPVVVDLAISHLLLFAIGLNLGAMKTSEIEKNFHRVQERAGVIFEQKMQAVQNGDGSKEEHRRYQGGS